MSFPFRSPLAVVLFFLSVTPLLAGIGAGHMPDLAQAATAPGSIMPQEGPVYDDLVNQTAPHPPMLNGREGYIGTHVDPATGDIITDVVSPRMPQQQQLQPPIYIQPRIDGYDYGINPDMQFDGTSGLRPGGHGWPQGARSSHRTLRPHGIRAHALPPDFAVTHPGQSPSGYPPMRPQAGPHVSGNSVQHPDYTLPGGNPGNAGRYMPQGRH